MNSLLVPIVLFACALGAALAVSGADVSLPAGAHLASTLLIWLTGTFLTARITVALTRFSIQRKTQRPPPKLLGDIIAGAIWVTAICVIAVAEFGVSPTAAAATSGVVIAVVGFAIRSLVSDLFYGLTMAIDRPFEIGDWVQLSDGSIGRVVEMTWRAVKLVTRENLKLIVPNTKLAVEQIANFDQPETFWRKSQYLVLGYEVKPEEVRRLLQAAVAEVPESASIPREPEALMIDLTEQGIKWELRYWLPDFSSAAEVGQRIREAFLRNMTFSGIHIPRRREEVYVGQLDAERKQDQSTSANWIEQVALFASAPAQVKSDLQSAARQRSFDGGTAIVSQGEPGSSLFVIAHGACDVLIGGEDGTEKVGAIGAGSVFGELSLLTGSPRSATVRAATPTVVYEIAKDDLAPALEAHPELATTFATVLADRRLSDAHRDQRRSQAQLDAERAGIIASLVDGARSFFRINGQ
jgi:small-conductance mechanosensitive channel/CRP-like cAMP-binding protein